MSIRPMISILVMGLVLINAPADSADVKTRIAVIGDLSTPDGPGRMMVLGAQTALRDAYASGRLPESVEMISADDQCKPDLASSKARSLIAVERIKFVIGHSCPNASLAASTVYAEAGVIQVDPVTTDPILTERFRGRRESSVFRISERQDRAASIAVFVLRNELRNMRIRLVGDKFRLAWFDNFKKRIGTGAKSVEFDETIPSARWTDGVSVFYDPYNRGDSFSATPGDISYVIQGPSAGSTVSAGNRDLIQKLSRMAAEAGYHMPIGPAINAYASVEVWVKAVSDARDFDSAKIIELMRRTTFSTIRGPIAFDETGDVRQPVITIARYGAGPIIQVPNQCNEDKCKNCACAECCPK
jgi:branched-chain amino acid transport system substrate-binding protein